MRPGSSAGNRREAEGHPDDREPRHPVAAIHTHHDVLPLLCRHLHLHKVETAVTIFYLDTMAAMSRRMINPKAAQSQAAAVAGSGYGTCGMTLQNNAERLVSMMDLTLERYPKAD